ncbi:MAG: serine/threonine protein kinase, partial [Planctomycetota bacterium]
MTTDRPEKIEELFHQARACDPAQRAAFLDEACGEDASLRKEVERLLDSHHKSTHFMEKPAWEMFSHLDGKEEDSAESLEVDPDLPYERLGEYLLIRRIGEGGMGVVYLAVQESLGRKAALKVIQPERMGSSEAEARFWREVEAVTGLRHNNLVTVYGSGEDQGIRYFAMEYVPGQRLDEIIFEAAAQGKKIPIEEALGWMLDIAQALDSAHQAGIIHRDVKPSNIRIKPDGQPMLLDFGLARHADLASLTLTGEFRGTPHYASPEQVKARRGGIDARTDIYSLGVTLYEAVTGSVPFKGETTEQVFHQILGKEPPAPRSIDASIPRDAETVILKAMEKEPERRYPTMAQFADDLGRLMRGEMILAKPSGFATRFVKRVRRNPALSTAVSVALAAMIILAITLPFYFAQKAGSRYLLDSQRLGKLLNQAERLWPAHPDKIARMEAWVEEAESLAGRLDAHRQDLIELRKSALPREGDGSAEPVWIFEDRALQDRHATLQELVAGLERFIDKDTGLLLHIDKLLSFSRTLHEESIA